MFYLALARFIPFNGFVAIWPLLDAIIYIVHDVRFFLYINTNAISEIHIYPFQKWMFSQIFLFCTFFPHFGIMWIDRDFISSDSVGEMEIKTKTKKIK